MAKTNSKLGYLQVCSLDRAKSSLPALASTGISMGSCARQAASGLLHFYLGRSGLDSTSALWVLCIPSNSVSLPLHVSFVEAATRAHSVSQTGNINDTSLWSSGLEEHMTLELSPQHLENVFYPKKWILIYHQQWPKLTNTHLLPLQHNEDF